MFFEHLPGQFQGLANRTSDKQRPGPLDLTLLFKEIVRLKKISSPTSSTRDLLMKAVQEYNKSISNRNWRVKDEVKKLVYNLIRCPVDVLDLLKRTCDKYRWEQSAFTLENLEGDYYIPGHVIGNVQSQPWREYKVRNTVTLFFWFVCFLEWMFFSKSGCWNFDSAREILHLEIPVQTVTENSVILWFNRVAMDHERKAPKDTSGKQKARYGKLCLVLSALNSGTLPMNFFIGSTCAL